MAKEKHHQNEYRSYWFYDLHPEATSWKHEDAGIQEVEISEIIAPNRTDISEARIQMIKKLIEKRDIHKLENKEGGIHLIEFEGKYLIGSGGNHRILALQRYGESNGITEINAKITKVTKRPLVKKPEQGDFKW